MRHVAGAFTFVVYVPGGRLVRIVLITVRMGKTGSAPTALWTSPKLSMRAQ